MGGTSSQRWLLFELWYSHHKKSLKILYLTILRIFYGYLIMSTFKRLKKCIYTFMVLSLLAVANQVTSGCQSQANTGPLWAVYCCKHFSVLRISHNWTLPLSETAEKVYELCGENWTSLTLSVLLKIFQNKDYICKKITI